MRYEGYLPISKEDMIERGIEQFDFVYVIGPWRVWQLPRENQSAKVLRCLMSLQ